MASSAYALAIRSALVDEIVAALRAHAAAVDDANGGLNAAEWDDGVVAGLHRAVDIVKAVAK